MFHRFPLTLLVFTFAAGCAGRASVPPLTADHPASPEALEAPLPPSSQTLAVGESAEMVKPGEPTPQMQHMGHEMGGMKHDMGGMQHDMKGMAPETAATRPGEGAAPSAPRITPTTFPATTQAAAIYTCPMHPEVMSNVPGRCPKCGMKLVKKEGQK